MSHGSVPWQDIQRTSWWYLLTAVFCFAGLAAGQDAGTPSWSAFDADPTGSTVVNLQNLNISLNIPVIQKNGAFPFLFGLYGNSNYYEGASSTWATGLSNGPQGAANGTMAWTAVEGVFYGSTSAATCPSTGAPTTIYGNFYLQFADGTSHPLPLADHADSAECIWTGFTGTTIDDSGYTVTMMNCCEIVSIYDKNGDSIAISQTSGNPSFTDANNNVISMSVTTGEFTDTLGLNVLTMTGGGTTSGAYTWTGPTTSEQVAVTATTYTALRSAFNCSGITDINVANASLSTAISFPDGTSMQFAYEPTPGHSGDATGRLTTLTLRSGGTVVFSYPGTSSNNYGMNCTYQIPTSMTRTTSDGEWTYTLSFFSIDSGSEEGETDTVLDPGKNKKIYTFTAIGSSAAAQGYTPALTEVQYYINTGTVASPSYSSTPTKQVIYCYGDGPSPSSTTRSGCPNALLTLPVAQLTTFTTLGGMSTSAETYTTYDGYGNPTLSEKFAYSSSSGGTPLIATTTAYGSWNGSACVAVNSSGPGGVSTINNKPCTIVTAQSGSTVATSRFTYSSAGNLNYAYVSPNGGSSFLSNTTANAYNSNGTPSALYDLANNKTTYSYNISNYTNCSSCSSLPFPTTITKGGLSTSAYYNGVGGVKTEDNDANGYATYYYYESISSGSNPSCSSGTGDPWWRITCVQDPLLNQVFRTYSVTQVSSAFSFNSGSSVSDITATLDWAGREVLTQEQQGPGSSNYDTTQNTPLWSGVTFTLGNAVPCTQTLSNYCTQTDTQSFDGLGRFVGHSNTGGGYTTVTYSQNDVLTVLGPAPSLDGENVKQVQNEYNSLGRLTKSCAIGNGYTSTCGQNTGSATGVTTNYTYSQSSGSTSVAATLGSQTRTNAYDGLGRLTSKSTPEGGTWNYHYDTTSGCPSGFGTNSAGNLVCSTDPNGNTTVYLYDSLNRLTDSGAGATTTTACKRFRYDNTSGVLGSIPSGISILYPYGRLVEAETDTCASPITSSSMITDEWFSYDKDGRLTDVWELTPYLKSHSLGYYHTTVGLFGNGALNTLSGIPGLTTETYGLDGEGRLSTAEEGTDNMMRSVAYNAASLPTAINLGSSNGTDNDAYNYDPNTGRMTKWVFTVGSSNQTGTLNWNPIGTLGSLAIVDGFNSVGTQTCNFGTSGHMGYDDWNRLVYDDCGSGGWGQQYSYDQYDNLTKSVISGRTGTTFNPGYSSANNQFASSFGANYDSSGNLTYDTYHHYAWNEFNKLQSVDASGTNCASGGQCFVYDALARVVETDSGSTASEILYSPAGKTAVMNGTTVTYAYIPMPGGSVMYKPNDTTHRYWHKDWLGSTRVEATLSSVVQGGYAFSPYGEVYNTYGSITNEVNFTGDTQDLVPGEGLFDTPNRELSFVGRWISPDPAAVGHNLYAYATNPNSFTDPLGLSPPLCQAVGAVGRGPRADNGCGSYGGGGCEIDGGSGDCGGGGGGLLGSSDPFDPSESTVACPGGACNGYINGQYAEFIAGAGGAQGYVSIDNISLGLYEANGNFYTPAQWQQYLAQTYAAQILAQYNRVSGNVAALFGDEASVAPADPNDADIIGGHANFDFSCSDWSVCGPGRYDDGVHIECASGGLDCDPGSPLVVHDDTVSPWTSPASFSFSTLFSANFWEHGFVDLIGGELCNCVFSH